jgi:hypothetical protein
LSFCEFHLLAVYSKNGRLLSLLHLSSPISSPIPSSLLSSLSSSLLSFLLSLRALSHLSSKAPFFFVFTLEIYISIYKTLYTIITVDE